MTGPWRSVARRSGDRTDAVLEAPASTMVRLFLHRIGPFTAARQGLRIVGGRRPWKAMQLQSCIERAVTLTARLLDPDAGGQGGGGHTTGLSEAKSFVNLRGLTVNMAAKVPTSGRRHFGDTVAARSGSIGIVTPPLDDLLDRLHVVALPMRVRFRGITVREVALIDGPAGWGEFGAFLEYEPPEAAHWLAAGIEAAYERAAVAAARPHPDQRHRARRRRRPGARRAGPLSRRAHRQGEGRRAGSDAGRRRRPGQRRSRTGADGAGRRQRRLERRARPSQPPRR